MCDTLLSMWRLAFKVAILAGLLSLGNICRYPCLKMMTGGKEERGETELKGLSIEPVVQFDRIEIHVVALMLARHIVRRTRLLMLDCALLNDYKGI